MQRYEKYKLSGVEWFGDIPEQWKVKKLKYNTYMKGRVGWHGLKSDEFSLTEGVYCITGTDFVDGKVNWDTSYRVSIERYEEDPYIQLKENDLLITKDGTIGKLAVVEGLKGNATLNSGILVVRPLNSDYRTDFMYWALQSPVFIEYNNFTSKGSTINHLYQETFSNLPFLLPSIREQTAIANFLDTKTAQINKFIADKQKLIDLLNEERTAIINHAVTRGINPNVKLKPSEIEWLGDIPEHWEVKKLKYVASLKNGFAFKSESYVEDGIPIIRIGDIKAVIDITNAKKVPVELLDESKDFIVRKGDLLLALTGATIGKTAIYQIDDIALLNQRVGILRSSAQIIGSYLSALAESNLFKELIKVECEGGAQDNIGKEQIGNFVVPLPNGSEQTAIVKYLNLKTAQIDKTISKIETEIELMQEYRTALISEAVTGKIKVAQD